MRRTIHDETANAGTARDGGGNQMRRGVLSLVLVSTLASCSAPLEPTTLVEPILIEQVDVLVLESFPPRANAHVRGIIGDGCSEIRSVTQSRSGNVTTVTILRERPRDAVCTQIAKLYDQIISLEGTFPPGRYEVIVNGFRRTFTTQ
jgi:hypothetical protein